MSWEIHMDWQGQTTFVGQLHAAELPKTPAAAQQSATRNQRRPAEPETRNLDPETCLKPPK
jgi:hypothetical protein